MGIKLVVSDIDGVIEGLLLPDYQNFLAFKDLRRRGILTTVATGRSLIHAERYLNNESFSGPVILESGAVIASENGKILQSFPVTGEIKRSILRMAKNPCIAVIGFSPIEDPNFVFHFFTDDQERQKYLPAENPDLHYQYTKDIDQFCVWLFGYNMGRIYIIMRHALNQLQLENEARFYSGIFRQTRLYDVIAPRVSKGSGIVQLASILKINLNEIVVFGHGSNDLEMFELPVGLKIAVTSDEDESPRVQQLADKIINPYQVAETLISLIKEGR